MNKFIVFASLLAMASAAPYQASLAAAELDYPQLYPVVVKKEVRTTAFIPAYIYLPANNVRYPFFRSLNDLFNEDFKEEEKVPTRSDTAASASPFTPTTSNTNSFLLHLIMQANNAQNGPSISSGLAERFENGPQNPFGFTFINGVPLISSGLLTVAPTSTATTIPSITRTTPVPVQPTIDADLQTQGQPSNVATEEPDTEHDSVNEDPKPIADDDEDDVFDGYYVDSKPVFEPVVEDTVRSEMITSNENSSSPKPLVGIPIDVVVQPFSAFYVVGSENGRKKTMP